MTLTLIISWVCAVLPAQIPSDDLAAYQAAVAQTVLLENDGDLLPLRRLDTLRPVYLNLGMADDAVFRATLNAYLPTGTVYYDQDWEVAPPYRHWGGRPNLLIIGIDAEGVMNSGLPFATMFLDPDTPIILVVFGQSMVTESLPEFEQATIVWTASAAPWHQSVAAQLLYGALAARRGLPVELNSRHIEGYGQHTEALDRLGFAPPAAVGMDARLLRDSIAAIVRDGLDHGAYPGAQVLVARQGRIVYHQAWGYHTDAEARPVRLTDIYDLASVTKVSSALPALMKAYGEGRFALDAPLSQYIPDFRRSNKADLPFRAMLAHHARLRPWVPYWQGTLRGNARYPWQRRWENERTSDYRFRCRTFARDSSARFPVFVTDDLWLHRDYQHQIFRAIRKSPLREKAEYTYSGLLFYLLPDMVARMEGENFETYLKETFYHPLGAYTLTYNPLRFFPEERIVPTERDTFFRMQLLHGTVHDEGAAMMGGVSGNAGLFANAYDLAKLMQLYLSRGHYGGEQLIPAMALDTFTARHFADEGNHRGLGFDKPALVYDPASSSVAEAASAASFGHAGYTGTFAWADPEEELLFLFLSNRVYPTRANRGLYIRGIRPRIHTVLYEAIREGE